MMRIIATWLLTAGMASAQTLPLPMPDNPERVKPDAKVELPGIKAEPDLQFKTIKNGYKVTLTKKGADDLLNVLNLVKDEKRLADVIAAITANSPPAEGRAQASLLGATLEKQLPLFKKKLAETNGPNGVVITVLGQPGEPLPIPPVARAAIDAFVPADVKETLRAGEVMITTKPGFWLIEKR